jgi:putative MATE family efflux protein
LPGADASSVDEIDSRRVLAIALPMTLAYLTTPLIGAVDTAVIGQYGDATLMGGIAVAALVVDIVYSTFNFLRAGTTGLTAQALGAGDRRAMPAILLRALGLAFGSGLVIVACLMPIREIGIAAIGPSTGVATAARVYLDIRILGTPLTLANYALIGWFLGLGRSGTVLMLQTLLNGVNIVLSFLLGLAFGWGIAGVAIAAVTGEALAVLVGLALAYRLGRGRWRSALPALGDRSAFVRMLAVNGDIMIRSFALLAAFALFTRVGARFGDLTLAANAVLLNFFMVGGYFLDGLANAAEQLAGRAVGARRPDAFRAAVRLTVLWGVGLAGAISAVFWLAGPALIALMAAAGDVRAAAGSFLPWVALTPLAGVVAFEMDGVYIGATWSRDMRNMMLASLALYVGALLTLVPLLGNHGLWLSLLLFLGVRAATLSARLPTLFARTFTIPTGSSP